MWRTKPCCRARVLIWHRRGQLAHREGKVWFGFDEVDRGADDLRRNELGLRDEFAPMGVIGGEEQRPDQTFDVWRRNERLSQDAVGPEQVLSEHRKHVQPAACRTIDWSPSPA